MLGRKIEGRLQSGSGAVHGSCGKRPRQAIPPLAQLPRCQQRHSLVEESGEKVHADTRDVANVAAAHF